jgi:hypothetical protein
MQAIDSGLWTQMIRDADTNGDGQIDLNEFINMMYTLKDPPR